MFSLCVCVCVWVYPTRPQVKVLDGCQISLCSRAVTVSGNVRVGKYTHKQYKARGQMHSTHIQQPGYSTGGAGSLEPNNSHNHFIYSVSSG